MRGAVDVCEGAVEHVRGGGLEMYVREAVDVCEGAGDVCEGALDVCEGGCRGT